MMFVNGVKKLSDILEKICLVTIVIMLAAMVGITCAQIIGRVWFKAIPWAEEATRYLLIWSTFLGASCVYKTNGHISITMLQGALPPKYRKILEVAVHILCCVVFAVGIYYGIRYMGRQSAQLSASLRIPMGYIYCAIPLGFGLSFFHAVNAVLENLFSNVNEEVL